MTIIEILRDAKVLKIELSEDKKMVTLTEGCDEYFFLELTKGEMENFIYELQEISKQMEA